MKKISIGVKILAKIPVRKMACTGAPILILDIFLAWNNHDVTMPKVLVLDLGNSMHQNSENVTSDITVCSTGIVN
jgi:hypothetical protein